MTFPATPDQGPGTKPEQYPGVDGIARYDEGILVGYRWYDQQQQAPLFPFGHGLSYTTFEYTDLRLEKGRNSVALSVTVRLATWSESTHGWKLWKGAYTFKVGESSRKLLVKSSIEIGSDQ
jgi:hypothetical protein